MLTGSDEESAQIVTSRIDGAFHRAYRHSGANLTFRVAALEPGGGKIKKKRCISWLLLQHIAAVFFYTTKRKKTVFVFILELTDSSRAVDTIGKNTESVSDDTDAEQPDG